MHKLLVYGILVNRTTLEGVIRHTWDGEYQPALVPDWHRYHKNGGSLWYAAPASGEVLEAELINGLTDEDLDELDRLEGHPTHYTRVEVSYVGETEEGRAWIYRDGQYRPAPSPEEITERARASIRRQADQTTKARRAGYQSLEDLANCLGIVSQPPAPGAGPAGSKRGRGGIRRIATTGSEPTGYLPGVTGNTGEGTGVSQAPERRTPAPEPHRRGMPVFAYGSLCFREILEERIGHRWPGEYRPATLPGWQIEAGWPRHAVPARGKVAHGFLLPDLTERDLAIIDRYEGVHRDVYRRIMVTLEDGTEAYFYSTGEAGHQRLKRRANGQEPTRRNFISGQRVNA